MKTRCTICKIEEDISKEETTNITRIIERNPKAVATDYLRVIAIARGPTCTGDKEHRLTFHQDFRKAVDECVANVNTSQFKFNELDNKEKELKIKVKNAYDEYIKMAQELANVIENKNPAYDEFLKQKTVFKDIAGSENIKLWS
jgi:hypothetical protein